MINDFIPRKITLTKDTTEKEYRFFCKVLDNDKALLGDGINASGQYELIVNLGNVPEEYRDKFLALVNFQEKQVREDG